MFTFACFPPMPAWTLFHLIVSQPRGGLPTRLAHAAAAFLNQIQAPPLGQLAGRVTSASGRPMPTFAQRLQAHVLEVLLCIFFRAVVRQSIAWVVLPRDLVDVNFSRAYLLLEPELFHLQVLHVPASMACQDAFDCRRNTVDLDLHGISELPTKLRNTKYFAARLQRSIQFGLSTRQNDTRLSS